MAEIDNQALTKRISYHLAQYKRKLKLAVSSGRHTGKVSLNDLMNELTISCNCKLSSLKTDPYKRQIKLWLENWEKNEEIGIREINLEVLSKQELCSLIKRQENEIFNLQAEKKAIAIEKEKDKAEYDALWRSNQYMRKILMTYNIPFREM